MQSPIDQRSFLLWAVMLNGCGDFGKGASNTENQKLEHELIALALLNSDDLEPREPFTLSQTSNLDRLLREPDLQKTLEKLEGELSQIESIGPAWAARFVKQNRQPQPLLEDAFPAWLQFTVLSPQESADLIPSRNYDGWNRLLVTNKEFPSWVYSVTRPVFNESGDSALLMITKTDPFSDIIQFYLAKRLGQSWAFFKVHRIADPSEDFLFSQPLPQPSPDRPTNLGDPFGGASRSGERTAIAV